MFSLEKKLNKKMKMHTKFCYCKCVVLLWWSTLRSLELLCQKNHCCLIIRKLHSQWFYSKIEWHLCDICHNSDFQFFFHVKWIWEKVLGSALAFSCTTAKLLVKWQLILWTVGWNWEIRAIWKSLWLTVPFIIEPFNRQEQTIY